MKKTFVLDTNVLLHDPGALFRFEDNDVLLPITVIEELDRFKRNPDETGRNARQVSRKLDELRERGQLTEGILLPGGGHLQVFLCHKEALQALPPELGDDLADNAILAAALQLKRHCKDLLVLVSKDTNLRIKADVLGLIAQDYQTDKVDLEGLYTGIADVMVSAEEMKQLFQAGTLQLEQQFFPNQALMLIDAANPSHTALAICDGITEKIFPVTRFAHSSISPVLPRNREQRLAFDLLLRDTVQLVTLVGKAGTGKTLLAITAGLQKVADEKLYSRLLIARPIVPMGRDLGYLPGDVDEKLTPWMQALYDNFDLILGTQEHSGHGKHWRRGHQELIEQGFLQIEPLTYIRGRSIPKQFFIVDEAQNLTPHEVKTILTRAGEGTKIVLTGDPDQIDNPYVDAASNGLTYVIERFKSDPLAAHVMLHQGERSKLAERAAELL